jgi:two-component system cell cycle response regulator
MTSDAEHQRSFCKGVVMSKKLRVLIVDDDKVLGSVLKEGLMAFEYPCENASNGETALGMISSMPFDIMVTDIIMPGMDGLELTYKVKQLRPEIAVIVMTGFQQEESYNRAIGYGASDFIKKPFSIAELIIRMDRIMRDSQVLAEIRKKQEEVRNISRDMIAGLQDEATVRITKLEEEIINLRKKIS